MEHYQPESEDLSMETSFNLGESSITIVLGNVISLKVDVFASKLKFKVGHHVNSMGTPNPVFKPSNL